MSLDNVKYYTDEEGYLVAENIYVLDSDEFKTFAYLIQDTANGGYWINAAVPEPCAYAALLGAMALGFAACAAVAGLILRKSRLQKAECIDAVFTTQSQ
ncbi:MAG: hypothetical protein ACLUKN_03600 [Bacilli bacterium]